MNSDVPVYLYLLIWYTLQLEHINMTGNNSAQGNQGGPYGALRDDSLFESENSRDSYEF